jgi:NAD(P)-dependent dehydrogenase (short-subunit alcohol dehydrogenase family)
MAVNVQAPADICRAAIAHFRATGGGIVINIASRAGHRGDGPDHAAYAASKGAVLAMTKTYARALAGENILFYAIAPGWVETRMAPQDVENRKLAVKDIPLGRVAAPEEVAEMIAFLASGACPSATGATFDINGASYVR